MVNDLNRNKILFVSWNQQNNMEIRVQKRESSLRSYFRKIQTQENEMETLM